MPSLFLYDFGSSTETRLTDADGSDVTPRFSPDGNSVAYNRDGRQIRVVDIASGDDRLVAACGCVEGS